MVPSVILPRQAALTMLAASALLFAGATAAAAQDPSASPSSAPDGMMSPLPGEEMLDRSAATEVDIVDFAFPADIRVEAGSSIIWQNADAISHTVTAADASFDSGRIEPGMSFEQVFAEPGVYAYSCLFHPAMVGTVTVAEAGASADASPMASIPASPAPEMTSLDD